MTKETDDDFEERLRKLERTNWGLIIAAIAPTLVILGLVFSPIWTAINNKVDQQTFVTHESYVVREFGKVDAGMLQLRKDWFKYTEAQAQEKRIIGE